MIKKLLLLGFILCQFLSFSQEDAWIYLTDKENVSFALQNPQTILTQQAIDRKNAHGIAIDERDVPVNESYISQLKQQSGITVLAKSKWFNAVHVRGSESDINALLDLTFVVSIDFANNSLDSESRVAQTSNKHNEEETLVNFNYGTTTNQVEMIGVDDLHIADYTGTGIIIAVLDSGFPNVNTMGAFQRLRDNGNLLNGYDFVNRTSDVYAYTGNSHGTRVLSTMAAYVQDDFVGTAPDASYYLFRTEDAATENPVEESYWVEAAERADSLGVHIINSSLGYTTYDNPNYSYTPEDMNGDTAYITRGANIANEKGILVVTSAGNSGNGSWQIVGAPADAACVLSIGAVNADGIYASFSSRGSATQPTQKPDVVARGASAAVVTEANTIVGNSGTSFSSPIMAGGIASLWQALPNATAEEIKQYVRMSASQYTTPDFFLGYGIPNLQLALDIGLSLQEQDILEINVFPNPVNDVLHIKMPSESENTSIILFDVIGNRVLEKLLLSTDEVLNMSNLSSGLYMLQIKSNVESKTIKLIKS